MPKRMDLVAKARVVGSHTTRTWPGEFSIRGKPKGYECHNNSQVARSPRSSRIGYGSLWKMGGSRQAARA